MFFTFKKECVPPPAPQEMRTVLYPGLLFRMVRAVVYNVLWSNELGVHYG